MIRMCTSLDPHLSHHTTAARELMAAKGRGESEVDGGNYKQRVRTFGIGTYVLRMFICLINYYNFLQYKSEMPDHFTTDIISSSKFT